VAEVDVGLTNQFATSEAAELAREEAEDDDEDADD
jgi:hypothetical protein